MQIFLARGAGWPPEFFVSPQVPKKVFWNDRSRFGQKLEISILISKKFEFFIFSKFEGLFAGTFERVKVAEKVKNAKFRYKLVKQSQNIFA